MLETTFLRISLNGPVKLSIALVKASLFGKFGHKHVKNLLSTFDIGLASNKICKIILIPTKLALPAPHSSFS